VVCIAVRSLTALPLELPPKRKPEPPMARFSGAARERNKPLKMLIKSLLRNAYVIKKRAQTERVHTIFVQLRVSYRHALKVFPSLPLPVR
jgi:hypothetical protein